MLVIIQLVFLLKMKSASTIIVEIVCLLCLVDAVVNEVVEYK